jgi:hypothetical protein
MDYALFTALAGTWRGGGTGSYPTIPDFDYTEELVVEPVPGRTVAHWRARSADGRTGEPRHAESGFLRLTGDEAELVVAHSFGIVEIATGPVTEPDFRLTSAVVWPTPTAKPVDRIERVYRLVGDRLSYELSMAAVGVPLTHHLAATLTR